MVHYYKIKVEFPNQVEAIRYLSRYGKKDHQMGNDWHRGCDREEKCPVV